MLYETGAERAFLTPVERWLSQSSDSSSLESFLASLRITKQMVCQRWGIMDRDVLYNYSFEIVSSAQVWKRKGSSWHCWQPSTEPWFVLSSGRLAFEKDSHNLCKSFGTLPLYNGTTYHSLSCQFVLSSPHSSTFLPQPCSSFFIVSAFSLFFFFSAPSRLSGRPPRGAFCRCWGPTLTDRQRDRDSGSVTELSGTQWPRHPHRWGDKWLNEPLYTLAHWDLRWILVLARCLFAPVVEAFSKESWMARLSWKGMRFAWFRTK